jgi:hypothetical protein
MSEAFEDPDAIDESLPTEAIIEVRRHPRFLRP